MNRQVHVFHRAITGICRALLFNGIAVRIRFFFDVLFEKVCIAVDIRLEVCLCNLGISFIIVGLADVG